MDALILTSSPPSRFAGQQSDLKGSSAFGIFLLFAVQDEELIIHDQPAAWTFVPDGLLSASSAGLGLALSELRVSVQQSGIHLSMPACSPNTEPSMIENRLVQAGLGLSEFLCKQGLGYACGMRSLN
ncbi:hypothetical protein [Laribacter hongkongensis]|uniref:hypothetical protein n=1 Tax=Laribacter hongkongensis TaxID=168471 RepID=UPI001EFEB0B1|nr:hypothetical protein [Laribacter hongkongensis]MCG9084091.1 hypothetical protein [Laribacter hongkongensis]